ncbi:hypothetical protein FB451DRAFT_1519947 [Mycena latifolia]|nr:hypothetical protein FB451DRAFT_1519947 [Mycena latifolia]
MPLCPPGPTSKTSLTLGIGLELRPDHAQLTSHWTTLSRPLPRSTRPLTGVLRQPENRTSSDERLSKSQLLVPRACTSGGSRQAEVYPYNPSIACRASVTTPTTTGEPFGTPSATYARLRARRRRPSRRRTPSREFVTRPASAAAYPSSRPARVRPRPSQTLDLVAPGPRHQWLGALRALSLDRLRIIRGTTSSTWVVRRWIGCDALGREGRVIAPHAILRRRHPRVSSACPCVSSVDMQAADVIAARLPSAAISSC